MRIQRARLVCARMGYLPADCQWISEMVQIWNGDDDKPQERLRLDFIEYAIYNFLDGFSLTTIYLKMFEIMHC